MAIWPVVIERFVHDVLVSGLFLVKPNVPVRFVERPEAPQKELKPASGQAEPVLPVLKSGRVFDRGVRPAAPPRMNGARQVVPTGKSRPAPAQE